MQKLEELDAVSRASCAYSILASSSWPEPARAHRPRSARRAVARPPSRSSAGCARQVLPELRAVSCNLARGLGTGHQVPIHGRAQARVRTWARQGLRMPRRPGRCSPERISSASGPCSSGSTSDVTCMLAPTRRPGPTRASRGLWGGHAQRRVSFLDLAHRRERAGLACARPRREVDTRSC